VYFCEKQVLRGKSNVEGEEMLLTWRMSGHDEDSLRAIFARENPNSPAHLRLAFVKALSNVSGSQIPLSVSVGQLLDDTVDYFMPTTAAAATATHAVAGTVQLEAVMERLRRLDFSIAQMESRDVQGGEKDFDAQLRSLQPVRMHVANRLRCMAGAWNLTEQFIVQVAGSVQKVLAQARLCLFTLRKMYATMRPDSVYAFTRERLSPFASAVTSAIFVDFIASSVCDFLKDVAN
jgi:hypothetical protein